MTSAVRAELKVKSDSGSWVATISSPSVDRDDEVIEFGAFLPLPDKIPVHLNHGGPVVGSGRPSYVGSDLRLEGRFASTATAQEARSLVKDGHIGSMSVVFLTTQTKQVNGRRHITSAELLAADLVTIPSNRDSQILAARSYSGPRTSRAKQLADAALADADAALALAELSDVEHYLDQVSRPRTAAGALAAL